MRGVMKNITRTHYIIKNMGTQLIQKQGML